MKVTMNMSNYEIEQETIEAEYDERFWTPVGS